MKTSRGLAFSGKESNSSLEIYLQEIGSTPLLTQQQEINLARRFRNGDKKALDRLITANLKFVVSVASLYQGRGLSLVDLINEGNLGLITAAKRFDPERGFRFISYADWWIKQAILQAVAESGGIVALPMSKVALISRIKKTTKQLNQVWASQASTERIAEALGLSFDKVEEALGIKPGYTSLDEPLENGESLIENLGDQTESLPDPETRQELKKEDIWRILEILSPREAEILTLSFGLNDEKPLFLEQIGERFNITKERVRQIKKQALYKLRQKLTKDLEIVGSVEKLKLKNPGKSVKKSTNIRQDQILMPRNKKFDPVLAELSQRSVKTPAKAFSKLDQEQMAFWMSGLRQAILALETSQQENLCRYYGLFDVSPYNPNLETQNRPGIFAGKEYALCALVKITGIAYCKLRRLMERNREIRNAHS
ncbi:MAG: RNA polymerase sigma factor RpoD/SigA [Patescibacteria group bacterium]